MIVSLSLILYDTGLRLIRQQIVTHCNSLMLRLDCDRVAYECERHPELDESYSQTQLDYDLVALRLKRLTILTETQMLYYSKTHMGES